MKRRQRNLVESGTSHGVLAFVDGAPVGWCAYAHKSELPKLQRSKALASDDAPEVWSIPCFFVKAGFRGCGVSRALLRHALRSIRAAGGRVAEAYPVRPPATNAAAFTGTVPFLESEGFVTLTKHPRGGSGRGESSSGRRRFAATQVATLRLRFFCVFPRRREHAWRNFATASVVPWWWMREEPREDRPIASAATGEDARFDLTLRPRNFAEVVGQRALIENPSRVFVKAAAGRKEPLDHVLFCGPPGLGKTSLAHVIAHELGA